MLPDIHRATQKFYIFLIVYLTGCTPRSWGLLLNLNLCLWEGDIISSVNDMRGQVNLSQKLVRDSESSMLLLLCKKHFPEC